MNPTTEQVNKGQEQDKSNVPNPSGKGGFGDNPDHINPGGRPKNQESFTYWMNHFKNMPVKDFLAWIESTPEETRSIASDLAWNRVFAARKDLNEFKEVADRTEGRSRQPIEMDTKIIQKVKVEIVENVPTS
jgi:hypothetical protein